MPGQPSPATGQTAHVEGGTLLEAYREFDRREPGWVKVALLPED